MEDRMKALQEQMEEAISAVRSKEGLAAFWQKYLSKNGSVANLMKGLRDVPPESRPAAGKAINQFKAKVEESYQRLRAEIEQIELENANKSEQVDITMPAVRRPAGALHPITITKNQMIDVFAGMGFEIFEGPEIEDDDHNFTRLNVAKNHPARDMQDQSGADPRYGSGETANQSVGSGPCFSFGQRRYPFADVSPDGRPCGRQGNYPMRPAGNVGSVCSDDFFGQCEDTFETELFSVYGAECGSRRQLL